jgi:hypothetical protein
MMKFLKEILIVSMSGVIVTGVLVFANISVNNPGGIPASTGVTLDDIYHTLNNTSPLVKNFNPIVGSDTANFHDLSEIYNLLETVDPETVTSNGTIMGIAGTYDISNLLPENVVMGTTYGTSSVGTME